MIELRYLRSGKRSALRVVKPVAVALSASLLAGCSADITRFDNPSFAFNDPVTGSVDTNAGYGGSNLSSQSPAPDYGRSYTGPVTSTQGVSSSKLPDIAQAPSSYSDNRSSYSDAPSGRTTMAGGYGAPPSASYDSPAPANGDSIVVQPGDTLYSLSRRHGVSLSELMSANGLTSSQLHAGQRLLLPAGASASADRSYAASSQPAPGGNYDDAPAAVAPDDWNGTYTVASGDALYGIARQHGVTVSDLQRYNGITDPRRIKPGVVLRVPGRSYGSPSYANAQPEPNRRVAALQTYSRNDATPPATTYSATATDTTPPRETYQQPATAPSASPETPNYTTQTRGVRTVSVSPPVAPSSEVSVASTGKLRWPVRGRVISNFGKRADGTHNDGVNLAVPSGAEVHAAEEGVVAYAGSELRGYGNLILLRHSNGWVTAYAHNDEMLVKRGDKVARGQIIAKAGNTGDVDQPQLHFELRMGSKPVDPLPYLETL